MNYLDAVYYAKGIGRRKEEPKPEEEKETSLLDDAIELGKLGLTQGMMFPNLLGGLAAETAGNVLQGLGNLQRNSLAGQYSPEVADLLQSLGEGATGVAETMANTGTLVPRISYNPDPTEDTPSKFIDQMNSAYTGALGNVARFFHADKVADAYGNKANELRVKKEERPTPDFTLDYLLSGLPVDLGERAGSMAAIAPAMYALPQPVVAGMLNPIAREMINRGMYGAAKVFSQLAPNAVRYGLTSAPLEGIMEGGMTRENLLAQGYSDEEATKQSAITALKNIPLLLLTNTLEGLAMFSPLVGAGKIATAGQIGGRSLLNTAQESYEEFAQEGIQNAAEGKYYSYNPLNGAENQYEAAKYTAGPAALTGLIGGGVGAYRGRNTTDEQRENQQNWNRGSQENISNDDYAKRANLTSKQAEIWDAAQYASARAKEKYGYDIQPELIYKQWAHEAGVNFDSENARYNNNFGGLTQTEPNGEENKQPDGDNYYRHFNNVREYADAYVDDFIKYYPEISGAKNEREFANVLKKYGYFGDSVENYASSMEGIAAPSSRTDFAKNYESIHYLGDNGKGEGNTWQKQNDNVSLDRAQPDLLNAIDVLGKWFYDRTGKRLIVTSGDDGDHTKSEHDHYNGWKVDVNDWDGESDGYLVTADGSKGSLTDEFIKFGQSIGLGMNWEGDHIDVALDGNQWADENGNALDTLQNFGGFNPRKTANNQSSIQPSQQQQQPTTPKPLFDINREDDQAQDIFAQFAEEKYLNGLEKNNNDEVDFFSGMFDTDGKFQSTKENRDAIRQNFTDEFTAFAQNAMPKEQPTAQPKQSQSQYIQQPQPENSLLVNDNLRDVMINYLDSIDRNAPENSGFALEIEKAFNDGKQEKVKSMLESRGVSTTSQVDPVTQNKPPENILPTPQQQQTQSQAKLQSQTQKGKRSEEKQQKLIADASAPVNTGKTPKDNNNRIKQAKAIITLANENKVQIPKEDKADLYEGNLAALQKWHDELSKRGLFNTAQPQAQAQQVEPQRQDNSAAILKAREDYDNRKNQTPKQEEQPAQSQAQPQAQPQVQDTSEQSEIDKWLNETFEDFEGEQNQPQAQTNQQKQTPAQPQQQTQSQEQKKEDRRQRELWETELADEEEEVVGNLDYARDQRYLEEEEDENTEWAQQERQRTQNLFGIPKPAKPETEEDDSGVSSLPPKVDVLNSTGEEITQQTQETKSGKSKKKSKLQKSKDELYSKLKTDTHPLIKKYLDNLFERAASNEKSQDRTAAIAEIKKYESMAITDEMLERAEKTEKKRAIERAAAEREAEERQKKEEAERLAREESIKRGHFIDEDETDVEKINTAFRKKVNEFPSVSKHSGREEIIYYWLDLAAMRNLRTVTGRSTKHYIRELASIIDFINSRIQDGDIENFLSLEKDNARRHAYWEGIEQKKQKLKQAIKAIEDAPDGTKIHGKWVGFGENSESRYIIQNGKLQRLDENGHYDGKAVKLSPENIRKHFGQHSLSELELIYPEDKSYKEIQSEVNSKSKPKKQTKDVLHAKLKTDTHPFLKDWLDGKIKEAATKEGKQARTYLKRLAEQDLNDTALDNAEENLRRDRERFDERRRNANNPTAIAAFDARQKESEQSLKFGYPSEKYHELKQKISQMSDKELQAEATTRLERDFDRNASAQQEAVTAIEDLINRDEANKQSRKPQEETEVKEKNREKPLRKTAKGNWHAIIGNSNSREDLQKLIRENFSGAPLTIQEDGSVVHEETGKILSGIVRNNKGRWQYGKYEDNTDNKPKAESEQETEPKVQDNSREEYDKQLDDESEQFFLKHAGIDMQDNKIFSAAIKSNAFPYSNEVEFSRSIQDRLNEIAKFYDGQSKASARTRDSIAGYAFKTPEARDQFIRSVMSESILETEQGRQASVAKEREKNEAKEKANEAERNAKIEKVLGDAKEEAYKILEADKYPAVKSFLDRNVQDAIRNHKIDTVGKAEDFAKKIIPTVKKFKDEGKLANGVLWELWRNKYGDPSRVERKNKAKFETVDKIIKQVEDGKLPLEKAYEDVKNFLETGRRKSKKATSEPLAENNPQSEKQLPRTTEDNDNLYAKLETNKYPYLQSWLDQKIKEASTPEGEEARTVLQDLQEENYTSEELANWNNRLKNKTIEKDINKYFNHKKYIGQNFYQVVLKRENFPTKGLPPKAPSNIVEKLIELARKHKAIKTSLPGKVAYNAGGVTNFGVAFEDADNAFNFMEEAIVEGFLQEESKKQIEPQKQSKSKEVEISEGKINETTKKANATKAKKKTVEEKSNPHKMPKFIEQGTITAEDLKNLVNQAWDKAMKIDLNLIYSDFESNGGRDTAPYYQKMESVFKTRANEELAKSLDTEKIPQNIEDCKSIKELENYWRSKYNPRIVFHSKLKELYFPAVKETLKGFEKVFELFPKIHSRLMEINPFAGFLAIATMETSPYLVDSRLKLNYGLYKTKESVADFSKEELKKPVNIGTHEATHFLMNRLLHRAGFVSPSSNLFSDLPNWHDSALLYWASELLPSDKKTKLLGVELDNELEKISKAARIGDGREAIAEAIASVSDLGEKAPPLAKAILQRIKEGLTGDTWRERLVISKSYSELPMLADKNINTATIAKWYNARKAEKEKFSTIRSQAEKLLYDRSLAEELSKIKSQSNWEQLLRERTPNEEILEQENWSNEKINELAKESSIENVIKQLGGEIKDGKVTLNEEDKAAFIRHMETMIDPTARYSQEGGKGNPVDTTIKNYIDPKDLTPQQKLLQDFGRKLGTRVIFFNNGDGRFHGQHSNGITYLNVVSNMPLGKVFWHESMHWLKANNPKLYQQLVKAAGITDEQRQAYLERTERNDLKTDEAIDEEIISDQFEDVAKRSGLLQSISGKNRGLIQRVIQWLQDTMKKFIEHFRNPQGKLTTAQAQALADEFGKIAKDLVDPNGEQIFRYNRRTHNVELANGRDWDSSTEHSDNRGAFNSQPKYSIDASDNSNESTLQRIRNKVSAFFNPPPKSRNKRIKQLLEKLADIRIVAGHIKGAKLINVDEFHRLLHTRKAYDWGNILPEIGGMLAKSLNIQDSEAMRNYVTDWLLTGAPNNNSAEAKIFQQAARNNPAMFEILQKIRDEFDEFNNLEPEERYAEGITDGEKTLGEKLGYYKDNWREEFTDDLHPIERMFNQVVAKAEKTNPKLAEWLKESVNSYELARLVRGMGAVADILVGKVGSSPSKKINEIRATLAEASPNVNFSIFKPITMILEEIGALKDKKRQRLFEAFCVAKLDKEMYEKMRSDPEKYKGITPFRSESDADATIAKYEKEFGQAQRDLVHYSNILLTMRYDAGLISKSKYNEILSSWKNYILTARVFEENEDYDFIDSLKQKTGSHRDIRSPIQKLIDNTNSLVKQAERNKVKCQVAQLARCGQFGQIIAVTENSKPNLDNTVLFYEHGKKCWLETPDLSVVRALNSIQSQKDGAWIVKAFNAAMSFFRSMLTTRNLDYAAGNAFRDSAAAYIHNKHLGYANPFMFFADVARIGLKGFWTKDSNWLEWQMFGGSQASFVSQDTDYVQRSISDITETGWESFKKHPLSYILDKMQYVAEMSETATRLTTYVRARDALAKQRADGKATIDDKRRAALTSRNATIDFSRAGTSTRKANRVFAFANAAVQDWALQAQTFSPAQIQKAINGNKQAQQQIFSAAFRLVLMGIVPTLLQFALMHRDDKKKKIYSDLHDWEKETYWYFGDLVHIPKSMDIGVRLTSAITDEFLKTAIDKDPAEWKRFRRLILDAAPGLTATLATPAVEAWVNYSIFRDAPIVPGKEQHLPGNLQYGHDTSWFAKFFGEQTGFSPRKIDYMISGYLGFMGRFFSHLPNYVGRGSISRDELPIVRRFLYEPYKNPKIVKDYYEALDEQASLYNGYKLELQKDRKTKPSKDFDPKLYGRLKSAQKTMQNLSKREKQIEEDPKLSESQRKEKLRELELRRIGICEQVFNKAR